MSTFALFANQPGYLGDNLPNAGYRSSDLCRDCGNFVCSNVLKRVRCSLYPCRSIIRGHARRDDQLQALGNLDRQVSAVARRSCRGRLR